MRVMHVINSLQGGGAENLLLEMLPRLKKHVGKLSLATLYDKQPKQHNFLASQGIEVVTLQSRWKYNPNIIKKLHHECRKEQYSIIHSHLFPAQYFVALLPQAGKFFLTTEHSTYNRRRSSNILRFVERKIYNRYHKIICISRAVARSLQNWVPETGDKTSVIYNGKDLEKYINLQPLKRSSEGFNADTSLVICVASLTRHKNHVTLIKALANLPGVHLLIAGDGPLKTKLQEFATSLGIENRVHFLGYRNDIPRLLAMADVFVPPSLWEGFGLAAIEAMAAGIPVIASDVPGLDEVVEHQKSGLLFPPQDATKLAQHISFLLKNNYKRQLLVERGKKRAHLFNIDNMVTQYVELYKEFL